MALIERQRKHFVKKLKNGSAQWEAPSYFHIMASSSELDGELGPDTSLMDVAGYFPGHLRLLANAHQMRIRIESMQSQHANDLNVISVEESVRTRLQESVVRREKEKREIEYARNTIEERFGSDIRRVRAEERSQPKPSSRARHSHSSFRRSSSNNRLRRGGGGSPTLGGPSSYSNMKLKYLRRLERNSSSGCVCALCVLACVCGGAPCWLEDACMHRCVCVGVHIYIHVCVCICIRVCVHTDSSSCVLIWIGQRSLPKRRRQWSRRECQTTVGSYQSRRGYVVV
jgi:hypothetical protein